MNTEADEISYEDLNAAADYYDNLKIGSTNMFRSLNEEEVLEFIKWADENYVPGSAIREIWHPVVQVRCAQINEETLIEKAPVAPCGLQGYLIGVIRKHK